MDVIYLCNQRYLRMKNENLHDGTSSSSQPHLRIQLDRLLTKLEVEDIVFRIFVMAPLFLYRYFVNAKKRADSKNQPIQYLDIHAYRFFDFRY